MSILGDSKSERLSAPQDNHQAYTLMCEHEFKQGLVVLALRG